MAYIKEFQANFRDCITMGWCQGGFDGEDNMKGILKNWKNLNRQKHKQSFVERSQ